MKIIAYIFVFVLNTTTMFPQTNITTASLRGVSFTDANTGTVVGDNGTILHTSNGGSTWEIQQSGTTQLLTAVCFTDANTGTVVGWNGIILRTTDDGVNWTSQISGTTNFFESVSFIDVNIGYAVGYNGTISKTTTGGATWTTQNILDPLYNSYPWLMGVCFTNANNGIVVGMGGIVLRTTNGGSNWSILENIFGNAYGDLYSVSFWDASHGMAVGEMGRPSISRTTNGGGNWTTQKFNAIMGEFKAASFTNPDTGTAVGWNYSAQNGLIVRTTDGGTTWNSQISGIAQWLNGVTFIDANTGTAVGDYGTILRTTNGGTTWILQSEGTTGIKGNNYNNLQNIFELDQNYPNPFNPNTTITFQIPSTTYVTLKVYDLLGKEVGTLVNEELHKGNYKKVFDGSALSSGMYLYKLQANDFVQTKKFLLVK
jgi:photosystem II stability/assembly factor-like uncharacterized protein